MSDKPELPASDTQTPSPIRYVNLYESEAKIYTRRISGFYQRLRRYTGLPLLVGYVLMPWLMIDGRPAMLFDLPERKFHILSLTFWPHDGVYLAWLLIMAAFALFTVTVLVGRVWCGFTCPQTVWTQMFIWAENIFQGDRNRRIKLDSQPWNLEKIMRKGATQVMWLAIALITGLTFVGYFFPIRTLIYDLFTLQASWAAAFWVFLFTAGTYINAGFLREQVCKYMCPYARFQSVMYDKDTLTVFYNYVRGEKRGARKIDDDYKAQGLGDCIDCSWCVQVCPVDIDIRDGLQSECIDCGLCVDACNSVMDKMDYPRGLISFTTEDAIETGHTKIFRPRLIGYAVALLVMGSVFAYSIATRMPLGLEVLRDRGVRMYRVAGADIQNVYTLKINNMDRDDHVYDIQLEGEYSFELQGYRPALIAEGEMLTIPVRVAVPRTQLNAVQTDLTIIVSARDNPEIRAQHKTSFIGPALRGR